ncbi:MAG: DNA-processing protein DprA [Oscillospiraceae bacterium]|nr:DNA-processing protein DprA [Oscillospiraceae bacterium]
MAALRYWLWLSTRQGLRPGESLDILEHFGKNPELAYYADPEEYKLIPGLSKTVRASLLDKSMTEANHILSECDRCDIRALTWQDSDYPERLRNIGGPPLVLYVKGRWPRFDDEAAVAMAGTRSSTPYGDQMAGRLAFQITRLGGLIVTGVVKGCDRHAALGALKAGGPLVAVLAGGVDVPYYDSESCQSFYADICQVGALVSEYPPGTPHLGGHFKARNRILTGLCVGTVCVEASEHSGTMGVAALALEQNRDLFAVPANAGAPQASGTLRLLKEGAIPVTEGRDVMVHYQSRFPNCRRAKGQAGPSRERARLSSLGAGAEERGKPRPAPKPAETGIDKTPEKAYITLKEHRKEFTDDEIALLMALREKSRSADELIGLTGLPAQRAAQTLTLLELRALVVKEGQQYEAKVLLQE